MHHRSVKGYHARSYVDAQDVEIDLACEYTLKFYCQCVDLPPPTPGGAVSMTGMITGRLNSASDT